MLLLVEAAVFDRPGRAELDAQLGAQATLLGYLSARLRVARADAAHVALLPTKLAAALGALRTHVGVVTWKAVLERFTDVAPPCSAGVLRHSLASYDALASKPDAHRANAVLWLSGAEIVRRYRAGTFAGSVGRKEASTARTSPRTSGLAAGAPSAMSAA